MVLITDGQFQEKVIENNKISIVIFAANWNGSSQFVEDHIAEIIEDKFEFVSVLKIDIENNKEIAKKYSLHKFPSTLIFKDGELIDIIEGIFSKKKAAEIINNLLNREKNDN